MAVETGQFTHTLEQIDSAVTDVTNATGQSASLAAAITSAAESAATTATADKITLSDAFGLGTTITATSENRYDLDGILTVGRYQCGMGAAPYVDHKPEVGGNYGFSLIVYTNYTDARFVQQLRYNYGGLAGCVFERIKTGDNTWKDWYKFTGDKYPYAKTNTELQRSVMPTNLLRTQRAAMSTNGVSLTPKNDGTYILNGTASANSSFVRIGFFTDIPSSLIGKTLKLTGGISASVSLKVYTSKTGTSVYEDTGSGVTFTLTAEMLSTPYDIRASIANGTECSNVTIQPMLCVADESGDFIPYIPTNDDIRKDASRFDMHKIAGTSYIALGDSIVEYQGTSGHPHATKGFRYGYIEAIEDDFGVTCTNLGQAGHTIVDDIATLLEVDYSDASIVTIGYGVNDARLDETLGNTTDTYDAENPTFCGALNALIAKIYGDNAFCNVIVLAPIQRDVVNNFGSFTPNSNGDTLEDFANACVAVAGYNATPCIDMFHNSRINASTLSTFLSDGVHPSNFGYKVMYSAMRSTLLNLVIPKD